MSGAFTGTRTSTNTCNSVAIKSLSEIREIAQILAKVYSAVASNALLNC